MALPSWLESILGRNGYQRTDANEPPNNHTNNNMPGAYQEEQTNTQPSTTVRESLKKISAYVNVIVAKPLIITLLLIFQLLSAVINILYFRDLNTSPPPEEMIDPIDKVNKFVRDLEDGMEPSITQNLNQLPPFFEGSYTQALYMATQRGKILFVYLTNPQNESASFIFNEIIMSQEFIRIFNKDIIIWGGDLKNPEAYQLANSLNVTKFPFLGVLCLTRGTKMTPEGPKKDPVKISMIAKLQGGKVNSLDDASTIIRNKFLRKIGKYEPELNLIRQELQDRYMTEVLRKQQEYNYMASMQQDMIKKNEKKKRALTKEYLKYKAPLYKNLTNPPPKEEAKEYARIVLKFPDSSRVTVYFPKHLKVRDVFTFVEILRQNLVDSTSNLTESEATNKFKNFEVEFKFTLTSPLPPRTDMASKKDEEIEQNDLIYPNGLLLVEDV
ncbi:ucp10 [Candida margitis]|uniref:ucp10 n=1 Tax=Candida margitis TaxID=1775924 RepID=UPI002227A0E7|nr:ucp10 [Candida margitis]KAI5966097.1 ucp10 [Candida margitis]